MSWNAQNIKELIKGTVSVYGAADFDERGEGIRIFDEGARDMGAGAASGIGMGLYTARMMTELRGGTITAVSESEKGSAFSVALPLSQT